MKIAVISDIHANLPALMSAMADARQRGAGIIAGAGDWVGYGPCPAEVVDYLRDNAIPCISGNYDIKVLLAKDNPLHFKCKMKPYKWEVLDWTLNRLDDRHVKWLANLPGILDIEPVPGNRVMICHGWPHDNEGRIYPDITSDRLRFLTRDNVPRVLVAGHTHVPFVKRLDGCLVVNAGSAGQPVDGDQRPSYCLLNLTPEADPSAQIIRFEYPLIKLLDIMSKTDLPEWLIQDFALGTKRK